MKKYPLILAAMVLLSGCETTQRENATTGETETNSATKGALIGAVSGALVGLATGDDADSRGRNALIGAAAGGAVGAGVGYYFDQQEAALRQELKDSGVQVKRVGEGQLQLVMEHGIGFQTSSYMLDSSIYKTLNGVAKILVEYPDTNLVIDGHTDSTGSDGYNQKLSLERANSVKTYLIGQQVAANRLTARGMGESMPICSNTTEEGRSCNRRVEINIVAQPQQ